MGPSGGDMAMIGDVAETLSLNFGKIPTKIKNELKKVNHPSVIISNPFDLQTYNWNDPKQLAKTFKLIFEESQSSVTPGQAAVFYSGEILLGGGLIN